MSYRAIQKGDRISEYALLEKLGQGGFGEVWKAEHSQIPGKFVAIKIPTSVEAMDCLKQEAQFQHELDHPNIVKTIGLNTQNDPPYFIMEYVEGKNLRQLMLDDGILPPPYAIDIAVQVCEALGFAHGKGIIHKDIKPENILVEKKKIDVSKKGKALLHYVKLTDLGLGMFPARSQSEIMISEHARTSGVRILSGTLFYMAPEQMVPGRQVDPRADIYSVGVVLYEMLTGELPLGMDLPSELNPVVTPELDVICKRALSIDRDVRYQSARELAADLQKAKEALLIKLVSSGAPALEVTGQGESRRLTPRGLPLPLPAASIPVPVPTPSRRRWASGLEWGFAAFVIALLAICGYGFQRIRHAVQERNHATRTEEISAPLGGPLSVDSKPAEAEVWVDERRIGIAPVQVQALSYERHTVRLVREFFQARELILQPRAVDGRRCFAVIDRASQKELRVRDCSSGLSLEGIELVRQKGNITITTPRVEKASVYIDGAFYGVTPLEDTLDAGVHQFTISKEGFVDLSFYEKVDGGARVEKPLTLLPQGAVEPAANPGKVTVHLTSAPSGASVYVNDEERGMTPLDLDVLPGKYELRLTKKYHEARAVTLMVDSPASREYELAKVHARVAFESEPQGATVYVDGAKIGVTPVAVEAVEGGPHRARFVLDGHFDQSASFEIVSREAMDRPIKATLQKIPPSRLVVETEIPGSEAYLDGRPIGRLPLASRSVESGTHKLRVLGVEKTLTLEAGNEHRVHFSAKDLEMVRVPEGEFTYGSATPNPGEVSARTEKTGGYFIDRTEVTNEQYAIFFAQMSASSDHSRCHPDEDAGTKQRNHRPAFWTDASYNGPKQPVVGVTWYDAYAYAAWAGKRLPTEREWEKAARGKTGWTYPWGNDWAPDEKRCNSSGKTDGYEFTAPVGACPGVSPYGCADMVGNVSEWCLEDYPGKSPSKVIRGGSFRDKEWVTTTSRWYERPDVNNITVGFRCVTDDKK
ncbi:MAG TPA: bifunctional serine/threonine-protein kinase/formylglycine-generating enzyme family protein [Planctomycetota bacterium]|nr:bifunctional serine/threonine-protein kinase/formylglycine-generating enzyme family protein [Planctomycetota bacterium]